MIWSNVWEQGQRVVNLDSDQNLAAVEVIAVPLS